MSTETERHRFRGTKGYGKVQRMRQKSTETERHKYTEGHRDTQKYTNKGPKRTKTERHRFRQTKRYKESMRHKGAQNEARTYRRTKIYTEEQRMRDDRIQRIRDADMRRDKAMHRNKKLKKTKDYEDARQIYIHKNTQETKHITTHQHKQKQHTNDQSQRQCFLFGISHFIYSSGM